MGQVVYLRACKESPGTRKKITSQLRRSPWNAGLVWGVVITAHAALFYWLEPDLAFSFASGCYYSLFSGPPAELRPSHFGILACGLAVVSTITFLFGVLYGAFYKTLWRILHEISS